MEHSIDSTPYLPTWQDNKIIKSGKPSFRTYDELSEYLLEKGLLEAQPVNHDKMDLRQIFINRVMPVVFALPWVANMLISWIPLTKISLANAPGFLILAALISTIEILSIVAVFICTSIRRDSLTDTEPSRGSNLKEKFFRTWSWFLFISPFVTGTMVVFMASDISCDPEDDLDMYQPICQVGIHLIKATALCRVGIIASFLFATSSYLEQRPQNRCSSNEST
ncbi:hypothetical protein FOVSG1_006371 [Fusarium oxysporum f. sp. vasinfectum]